MPTYVYDNLTFDYTFSSKIYVQKITEIPLKGEIAVQAATSKFYGKVTAKGPEAAIAQWCVGFIQEINYSSRVATYENGLKIEDRIYQVAPFEQGISMRDSQCTPLPFDGSQEKVLTPNGEALIESSDEPVASFPLIFKYDDLGREGLIESVSGRDEFSTWLAVYNETAHTIVILSRIDWRVHYDASVAHNPLRFNKFEMKMVKHEAAVNNSFVYPNSPQSPKCLREIEGNDFVIRIKSVDDEEMTWESCITDPDEPPPNIWEYPRLYNEAKEWKC